MSVKTKFCCCQILDSAWGTDEAGCPSYACPGLYRCQASDMCLTAAQVCDGVFHCPARDDELLCGLACPPGCTCRGHAFFCARRFNASAFPELRFLHAAGSRGGAPDANTAFTLLVYLGLARCGLQDPPALVTPNLKTLILSSNFLTEIYSEHLRHFPKLRHLAIDGNPLTSLFVTRGANVTLFVPSLRHLDLSNVSLPRFSLKSLHSFKELSSLSLNKSKVSELVSSNGQDFPSKLRAVDLRGCPMTHFPKALFGKLSELREVRADNYKLCCPDNLPPGFNPALCQAPTNELSSCRSLLRSHLYRVFLALFAILALVGNFSAFLARLFLHRIEKGFDVFTLMLCVSDLLMGVYLAVIGVADRVYLGSYLWEDVSWRTSVACTAAGFLCMLSNEVSALTVCLITLDRLLVLRFPFSRLRFSRRTGALACCSVWGAGLMLAAVPLLPATRHWNFYSQTAVCVPLPITQQDFPGYRYAFSLFVVLNLILFMLIAAGQLLIYVSVQGNSLQGHGYSHGSRDARLARRLLTVALADFLCWFPVGLLGVLAALGVAVSGEVTVALAVFVLPVNAAINPFLYTVNRVLERRRLRQEERLVAAIAAKLRRQDAAASAQ